MVSLYHWKWWGCKIYKIYNNLSNINIFFGLISGVIHCPYKPEQCPQQFIKSTLCPPTILGLPSSVPVLLVCPGQISIQNRAFVRRPSLYLFWTIHYKSQYRSISSKLFVNFFMLHSLLNSSLSIYLMYRAIGLLE